PTTVHRAPELAGRLVLLTDVLRRATVSWGQRPDALRSATIMKSPSRWCSLGSLGWMRGGYLARRPPAPRFSPGAVRALQAGDVGHAAAIRWDSLNWLEAEPFPEKYTVSDGDVLMPLRANPPRAIVARGVPDRVVVVGHWALITPDPTRVDPGFLVWYLNHPAT